jgi:hypothetical protein
MSAWNHPWHPDWRGRRRYWEAVRWARTPECDVAVGLYRYKTEQGFENRWFLLFRRIGQDEIYQFPVLAQTFLTSSPGTAQTWTSDVTWNNTNNTIETVAGGGSGAANQRDATTTGDASGGGAGEYGKISNYNIAAPGATLVDYLIGAGGAAVATTVASTAPRLSGSAGQNSIWDAQNFQTQSQFVSGWTAAQVTLTANFTTAPDGTTTAAKEIEDTSVNAAHDVEATPNSADFVPGATYTVSCYAKPLGSGSNRRVQVGVEASFASTHWVGCAFDVNTNQVGGNGAGAGGGFTFVSANIGTDSLATGSGGNGWYRCSVVFTVASTETQFAAWIGLDNLSGTAAFGGTYTGDGASGLLIWGAQITLGSTLRPYVATTTTPLISLSARGGGAGVCGLNGGGAGGTGGRNDSGSSPVHRAGGKGGSVTATGTATACGAGGAGGPTAAGAQGVDTTSSNAATNGGAADVGGGGAGTAGTGTTTSPGGNGGNGTELGSSNGCGGGGGACRTATNAAIVAGSGGNYGGGGGGAYNAGSGGNASTKATSGAGIHGIIVLTWSGANLNWGFDDGAQRFFPRQKPETRSAALAGANEIFVPPVQALTANNPMGWHVQEFQPPHLATEKKYGGIKHKSEFAIYPPFVGIAWQVQPWQPPHPKPEKFGALVKAEDGIDALRQFRPMGFEPVLPPPPHPTPERRAGAIMRGDDGTQDIYRQFFDYGFHVQPWQPLKPRPERGAAFTGNDDAGPYPFISPVAPIVWWGEQSNDLRSPRRGVQGMANLAGGDVPLPAPSWVNSGWEIQPPQPPYPRYRGAYFRGEDGAHAPFSQFFPMGWEVQPPQPPAFRRKFSFVGDEDIQNVFSPVTQPPQIGWEVQAFQPPQPRSLHKAAVIRGEDGILYPQIVFNDFGFENQAWQPPFARRRGATMFIGEDGIQSPFAQVVVASVWWGEQQAWQPPFNRLLKRGGGLKHRSEFAIYPPFVGIGWEVQPWQPPRARWEKSGGLVKAGDGIEFPFIPPVVTVPFVDSMLPALQYPRRAVQAGIRFRSEFAVFAPWVNSGWEVQPPQPPYPRYRGSFFAGETGIELPFVPVITPPNIIGWEFQPPTPPHPRLRLERFAATQWPELGLTPIVTPQIGWLVQPWQPPARIAAPKAAGFLRGDEGAYFPLIQFRPMGWHVQEFQPPHPRREKWSAMIPGDTGTAGKQPDKFQPFGWFVQPWQPPHYRPPRYKTGAFSKTGFAHFIAKVFITFYQEPVLPWPLKVALRGGSFIGGNQGIDGLFIPPVPMTFSTGKIIPVDTAFGSELVLRWYMYEIPPPVYVGDRATVVMETGFDPLHPSGPYDLIITRPDGSQYIKHNMQVFDRSPRAFTALGRFRESTYIVYTFVEHELNQPGQWSVDLVDNRIFASAVGYFRVLPVPP